MSEVFKCSNCDRPLAELEVTKPDVEVIWSIRAECPYGCVVDGHPDTSFPKEIRGLFSIKGIDRDDPTDADGKAPVTNWLGTREDGDILTILVGKA